MLVIKHTNDGMTGFFQVIIPGKWFCGWFICDGGMAEW